MTKTIKIDRHAPTGFIAQAQGDATDNCGYGQTIREAIGDLIAASPGHFNIVMNYNGCSQ